jgi:hypothetical protein
MAFVVILYSKAGVSFKSDGIELVIPVVDSRAEMIYDEIVFDLIQPTATLKKWPVGLNYSSNTIS